MKQLKKEKEKESLYNKIPVNSLATFNDLSLSTIKKETLVLDKIET